MFIFFLENTIATYQLQKKKNLIFSTNSSCDNDLCKKMKSFIEKIFFSKQHMIIILKRSKSVYDMRNLILFSKAGGF